MKDKLTRKQNNETLTRGIKHWGLSGYSNFLPRIKFGITGQDSSSQSPTISYRQTLGASAENCIMKNTAKHINKIAQDLDTGMKVFINKDTLEIKSILDWDDTIEGGFWETEMEEIENSWSNFAVIEKMESWEAFQVMEAYSQEIDDKNFREELIKILSRKSPFANFKAEIESSPYRNKWFEFKQRKYEEYVAEKLKEERIEIERSTST